MTKELIEFIKKENKFVKGIYEYEIGCRKCGSHRLINIEYVRLENDEWIWYYDCGDCGNLMEGPYEPKLYWTKEIREKWLNL